MKRAAVKKSKRSPKTGRRESLRSEDSTSIENRVEASVAPPGSQKLIEGAALAQGTPFSLRFLALIAFATIAISLALYGFTLNFPFQFDDYTYLVLNPVIKDFQSFGSWSDFSQIVNASRTMGLDPDVSVNYALRPLTYFTFHLNYLFDGLNPWSYRLVNVLIHAANTLLLFFLLARLLQKGRTFHANASPWQSFIPIVASLLFLVHPMQTETVTYIAQRFTGLSCFASLMGLLCAFEALTASKRSRSVLLHTVALLSLLLGMFCKENACMAPLYIIVAQMLFLGVPLLDSIRRSWFYLPLLPIVPLAVFAVAHAKHGGNIDLSHALNAVNTSPDPSYALFYALTEPGVIVSYMRLLILPVGQSVDPDFKIVTSLVSMRFLVPSAIITAMIASAWQLYKRKPDDHRRALILYGVFWFFLSILPSSSIIPLPDFMAEHRAYLPSIGFFITMATLLDWAGCRLAQCTGAARLRWIGPSVAAASAMALGITTIRRNEVWRTTESLWSDAILHSPGKARPWANRAVCHYEAGEMDQALNCFKTALHLDPGFGWGYMSLGRLYNIQHNFAEGLKVSEEGIRRYPKEPELCFNMGISMIGLGRIDEGKSWFKKALELAPMHALSHKTLGQIYAAQQKYEESLRHLQTARALMPDDQETLSNLANVQTAMQSSAN